MKRIILLIICLVLFGCMEYDTEYIPCCPPPLNFSVSNMTNCTLLNGTQVEVLCDITIVDEEIVNGTCYYETDDPTDPNYFNITFPICTHAKLNPCVDDQCMAMVCGKASYLPSLSPSICEITENHSLVVKDQMDRSEKEVIRELYKTYCEFKILDQKTVNEITNSEGKQWINAFRFGIGTTFSEFEESRYYFPVYDKLTYLNPMGHKDRFMNYLVPEDSTCKYEGGAWKCQKPGGTIESFPGWDKQHECEQACAEAWEYSLFTRCTNTTNAWVCEDRLGDFVSFNYSFFPDIFSARQACELFCDRAWNVAITECTTTENHPVFMDERASYYLETESVLVNQGGSTSVMNSVYSLNRSFYAEMLDNVWGYQKYIGYTDGDGVYNSGMIFECKSGIECLSGLCTNDWGYKRDVCKNSTSPDTRDIACHCRELDNGIVICYTGEAVMGDGDFETTQITGCLGTCIEEEIGPYEACRRGLINSAYCTGCSGGWARPSADDPGCLNEDEYCSGPYAPFPNPGCCTGLYCNPSSNKCEPIGGSGGGGGGSDWCIEASMGCDCTGSTNTRPNCCPVCRVGQVCEICRDKNYATCIDGVDNDGDGLTDCCDPDCRGIGPCQPQNILNCSDFTCGVTVNSPSQVRFKPESLMYVDDDMISNYISVIDEYIYVNPRYIDIGKLYFARENRCNSTIEMETVNCYPEWRTQYNIVQSGGTPDWNIVKECIENKNAWGEWFVVPMRKEMVDVWNTYYNTMRIKDEDGEYIGMVTTDTGYAGGWYSWDAFRVPFRYKVIDWNNCLNNGASSYGNIMPDLRRYGWCEPSTMVTMAVQEITVSDTYTNYCPEGCESVTNGGCNCNGEPLMYEKGTIEPSVKYLYDKKIELQKLNVMPILIAKDGGLYVSAQKEKCGSLALLHKPWPGSDWNPFCDSAMERSGYKNLLQDTDGFWWCYKDGFSQTNCNITSGTFKYFETGAAIPGGATLLAPYFGASTDSGAGGYGVLGTGTEIIVIGDIGKDSDDELDKRAQAIKKECPNCLVAIHAPFWNVDSTDESPISVSYQYVLNRLDFFFGYEPDNPINPKLNMNNRRLNNIDLISVDFYPIYFQYENEFYNVVTREWENSSKIASRMIDIQTNFQRQFLERYEKPSLILDFNIPTRQSRTTTKTLDINTQYIAGLGGLKGASYDRGGEDVSVTRTWRTKYADRGETGELICYRSNDWEEGCMVSDATFDPNSNLCADASCWPHLPNDFWHWGMECGNNPNTYSAKRSGSPFYYGPWLREEDEDCRCGLTTDEKKCRLYKIDRKVELPPRDQIIEAKITVVWRDDCSALEVNGNRVHVDTGKCTGSGSATATKSLLNEDISDLLSPDGNNVFSIYVMDYKKNQVGAQYRIEYTTVEYEEFGPIFHWSSLMRDDEFINTFYEQLFTRQEDLVSAGIIGIVYSEWRDKGDGTGLILGADGKTEHFCALQENSKELIGTDNYVAYSKVYAWPNTLCECLPCSPIEFELGICGDGTNSHLCEDGKPCGVGGLTDADGVKCMPMCARIPVEMLTEIPVPGLPSGGSTEIEWALEGCDLCNESTLKYDCKVYFADGTIEQGQEGYISELTMWDADIIGALPKEHKCCVIDGLTGSPFTYTKSSFSQLNNELLIFPRDGDPGNDCGKIGKSQDINTCPGSPNLPMRRGELVCFVN